MAGIFSPEGSGSGLGNALQNRLLQSMLLSTGAALNPTGISPALNQTLQPVIAAKSQAVTNKKMMQMLAKLTSKGIDFKSDEKGGITIKGENLDSLVDLMSGGGGSALDNMGLANEGSQGGGSGTNWNVGNTPQVFNPFQ